MKDRQCESICVKSKEEPMKNRTTSDADTTRSTIKSLLITKNMVTWRIRRISARMTRNKSMRHQEFRCLEGAATNSINQEREKKS